MAALLDHAGFVGRDMTRMRAAFTRLGFSPTEPRALSRLEAGRSVPLGQSSAHIVFGDTYLELSAVETDSPTHHLAGYAGRYEGLHILALRDAELQAAHAAAARVGAAPMPIAEAAREVDYGAGSRPGLARFEWFALPQADSPEGLTCLMRHLTPELVFQPAVQRHANGALALDAVWVTSAAPEAAARRFAGWSGGRVEPAGRGFRVALGQDRGRIEVVDPQAFASHFDGAQPPAEASFAALTLRVADLAATRALLESRGVPHGSSPSGGPWVAGTEAAGAVLEFVA